MTVQQLFIVLGLGIVVQVLLHLAWGPISIDWLDAWSLIDSTDSLVLFHVRLPRVVTAMAAGSGLALSGLLLQTWFHNPLAGPSVLGISAGSSMGVALVLLTGLAWGWWGITSAAVLGGMLTLLLILLVSRRFQGSATLLIFGLMLSYVVGALVTVLQAEAAQDALQQFVFWGMGTFGQAPLKLSVVMLVMVLLAWKLVASKSRDLDAWTLGSLTAQSMGVDEKRLKYTVIGVTGVLAGIITAVCGPVAFLGLAIPHLVRLMCSERSHRLMIPLTILTGAFMALLADWGVRAPGLDGGGWPLNAVLSLLGGPMVVWVLFRKTWNA
ncbi:MAG: iron ABC transporter permease [Bacteroidetes bacterium]|jgi:iron complex transport system permease protein|nr:iron ABC transporter permease [Bacteroidota bacterium]